MDDRNFEMVGITVADVNEEKAFYTVEIRPGIFTDVMCCGVDNHLVYLMQLENGDTLYDNGGNPVGHPDDEASIIEFVKNFEPVK